MQPKILHLKVVPVIQPFSFRLNRAFSLTWSASMQIYWKKRKFWNKKIVQLPEDWFGTPTWPPFHCFGTPIWPPWRHVKTLYRDPELMQRRRRRQRERQKSNRFRLTKQQLYVCITLFCTFLCRHCTFCGESEHQTKTFFFFSWPSIKTQLQKKLPTFDELNETE